MPSRYVWFAALGIGALGSGCGPSPSAAQAPESLRAREGSCAPGCWYDLAAGRRLGRERGVPLLVVVCPPPQAACPAAEFLLERLGRAQACPAEWVPVLVDGRPSSQPEERRLVRRTCPEGLVPVLVVATPDLQVLYRQEHGLYPFFDRSGIPLTWDPGPLLEARDLPDLVHRALARAPAVEAELARLASRPEAADRVLHAERLLERCEPEGARQAIEPVLHLEVPPDLGLRLHAILLATQEQAAAQALLAALVARHPDHAAAGAWRLRLLRAANDRGAPADAGDLEGLLRYAQALGDHRLEFEVRSLRLLVDAPTHSPDPSALHRELKALRTLVPQTFPADDEGGARAVRDLVAAALRRKDFADADRWVGVLSARFPRCPPSLRLRHGQADCVRAAVVTGRLEPPTLPRRAR